MPQNVLLLETFVNFVEFTCPNSFMQTSLTAFMLQILANNVSQ